MPKAGPDELGPPGGTFVVGYEDGAAVCCGGIKRLPDGACEIKRMFVVEQARGRGVARELLVELERRARELGYAIVRLDTGPAAAARAAHVRARRLRRDRELQRQPGRDVLRREGAAGPSIVDPLHAPMRRSRSEKTQGMTNRKDVPDMSIDTMDSESWIGSTLIDRDDRKVGRIEAIYFDEQTGRPQWMAVKAGLLGKGHNFVPLADAVIVEDAIKTSYDKSQIDDAPKIDPDEDLREDQVVELYGYYGLSYDAAPAGEGEVIVEREVVPPLTDPDTQADDDMLIATGRVESPYRAA